jgi:tetratricopeptide (TPR) repeat protein
VVAIAMRYLAMAGTSWGVSMFHEPDAATSWADPWWLAGLAALILLGWRMALTLWRREEEAAFWVLAAASFAPVSQVFPFIYPMGDRYLYPILPGLIGGLLLAARAPAAWLQARAGERAGTLRIAAGALAVVLLVTFAVRSERRAPVFRTNLATMIDAALNYPQGLQAALLRGHRAAVEGDGPAAARAFGRAIDLGFSDLQALLVNPSLATVRDHPEFQQVLRDMAAHDIARLETRESPGQSELMALGLAHRVRGEREAAIRAYERALASEGPFGASIRRELSALRRAPRPSDGGEG